MSTHSSIAVLHKDGSVSEVYCHFDGYPEGVGKFLKTHYNTQELADALVALGDMSYLAEKILPIGIHSYDKPESGVTVFYGRDRGEDNTKPRLFKDLSDYRKNFKRQDFNYLFRNNEWECVGYNKGITLIF